MTTTTLRRNSKRLRAILSSITSVNAYSLLNGFSGEACKPLAEYGDDRTPWGWLRAAIANDQPSLRLNDAGRLVVLFHSNYWLEITFSEVEAE